MAMGLPQKYLVYIEHSPKKRMMTGGTPSLAGLGPLGPLGPCSSGGGQGSRRCAVGHHFGQTWGSMMVKNGS